MLSTVIAARHTTGLPERPVSYVLWAVSAPSSEMAADRRVSSSSDDDGEVRRGGAHLVFDDGDTDPLRQLVAECRGRGRIVFAAAG
jgi:hypothetical protein